MNDTHYAVVVGIDHYARVEPDLKGAVNDANRFREWLIDPNGGDLPDDPDHIMLVSNSEDGNQPRLGEIEEVFADLVERIEADEDEPERWQRLYIYMAGHGVSETIDDACILAANHRKRAIAHFPAVRYANVIAEAAFFREIVVFMDCCRDDSPADSYMRLVLDKDRVAQTNVRRLHGFATGQGLKARERDFSQEDGKHDYRGIFTEAVLRTLEMGDAVTTDEFITSVKSKVNELREPNSPQKASFTLRDDIPFHAKTALCALLIELSDADDEVLIFGNDLHTPLKPECNKKGDNTWEVMLPQRHLYKLRSKNHPERVKIIELNNEERHVTL